MQSMNLRLKSVPCPLSSLRLKMISLDYINCSRSVYLVSGSPELIPTSILKRFFVAKFKFGCIMIYFSCSVLGGSAISAPDGRRDFSNTAN